MNFDNLSRDAYWQRRCAAYECRTGLPLSTLSYSDGERDPGCRVKKHYGDGDMEIAISGTVSTRLATALLVVMAIAGCRAPHSSPPLPSPTDRQEENQRNFEAMVSVLAHAYWRGRPPRQLRALPLESVVQRLTDPTVLACDRAAGSRRRRAIATLAAYGLGIKPIEAALDGLGAPVRIIKQRVREQERSLGAAFTDNAAYRQTFIADLPELRDERNAAGRDPPPNDANCWSKLSTRIYPERLVSVVVDVEARNSVDGVAKGLDPQSWGQCGTAWKTGKGTFLAHLDNNTVVPDPEITPHGQAYVNRSLYENFLCQLTFCDASFELFLGVTATKATGLYHVEFWLTPGGGYPKGTIFGKTEDLLADQGNLEVRLSSTAGVSTVHGEKAFALKSDSATALVASFLQQTELSSELGELACCFRQ